jgi:Mor family transcriptional regulator
MPRISKAELLKLQKKLVTDQAIGKKFHVTRQAIQLIRKKYGIDSNYAKNPARNKSMVALYKKGASGNAIAKKFDMSVYQTYRIIKTTGRKR